MESKVTTKLTFVRATAQGNIYADYRFGWGAAEIALFLGFVGIVAMVTQGLIVNLLIPRLGEHNCLLLGSVVGVFHMAVLGLAWEGWMWCVRTCASWYPTSLPPPAH